MSDHTPSEKKSSQQLLLLVLLLLVAVFGYLYFFTSVIRPRVGATEPQPVQTAKKTPLPSRPGQNKTEPEEAKQAKLDEKVADLAAQRPEEKGASAKGEKSGKAGPAKEETAAKAPVADKEKAPAVAAHEKSVAKSAVQPAVNPAVKPAVKPAEKPAEKPVVKQTEPFTPAAQPKAVQPKAATPVKGAAPVAAAGKDAKAEASANGKTPTKTAIEKSVKAAETKKSSAAAAKAPTTGYTLEIAGDLLESEMGSVKAKLKKAGIEMVAKNQVKKGEPMHRLFLADFANHDEALEEVERLRLAAPDAFMLNENGRYAVYAGSYLREKRAALEQDRLYDKGVKLLLRTATAQVSVLQVRAGSFTDAHAAERAQQQLKKAGLDAKVVKARK